MKVLGVMSGTSLDGLDLALVEFRNKPEGIGLDFEVLQSETLNYGSKWTEALKNAPLLSGKELTYLDVSYGRFVGETCAAFLAKHNVEADLIASHGHTVFHEPDKGYTLQIGNGVYIAEAVELDTIYDFRSADLAQNGQGAPLVPIGDLLLFGTYDCCINLGGIANLSRMKSLSEGIGYDICPFNILLNHYSEVLGAAYDKGGAWARAGKTNPHLLEVLNKVPFYEELPPKSLDKEAILKDYLPLITNTGTSPHDVLATLCDHFSFQTAKAIDGAQDVLLTGGGAFNSYFVERLQQQFPGELHLPSQQLIEFKEAIIFALLGYLRYHKETNTLSVITGGTRDLSSGILIKHSK